MRKSLIINLTVMFILSVPMAYFSLTLLQRIDPSAVVTIASIVGRAIGSVLFPLIFAAIPAGIYRYSSKKAMPRFFIVLWVLWLIVGPLALYGNMIEAVSR